MREPLRVLIVEDCPDTASSTAMILGAWGAQTSIAYNGKSALAEAERSPPDIILLDTGLPDMNGLEVARTLRKRSEFHHTMIVVISGYASDNDHAQSIVAGCHRYLVKPVSMDDLARVLDRDIVDFRRHLRRSEKPAPQSAAVDCH